MPLMADGTVTSSAPYVETIPYTAPGGTWKPVHAQVAGGIQRTEHRAGPQDRTAASSGSAAIVISGGAKGAG